MTPNDRIFAARQKPSQQPGQQRRSFRLHFQPEQQNSTTEKASPLLAALS